MKKLKKHQKQDIIAKIASFRFKDLKKWIRGRLKGNDKLCPIKKGDEQRKFELIAEAYGRHSYDINFMDKFILLMDILFVELAKIAVNKKSIVKNKEYIFELISLFERIPDFKSKSLLYHLAKTCYFIGIKAFDDREETDLHRIILNALASNRVGGYYEFWIEQIIHNKNKWYVRTSFYAMLNRQYRLDIILKPLNFGIFIDSFKDDEDDANENELKSCIEAIMNGFGKKKVLHQLKNIDEKLNAEQRVEVKNAM